MEGNETTLAPRQRDCGRLDSRGGRRIGRIRLVAFAASCMEPTRCPAYFSLVILLIGYGMANIFHWNRPLLLAFGMPGFPVMAMTVVGVVEIALIFLLVPHYGYLAESAIVSGYFVVAIGWIVWRGLSVLHQKEISAE